MAYSLIEHTADTGFRVTADSVQGLFADAGMALADIAGASGGREIVRTEVTMEGIDQADLLVRWLQELLYLMEVRRLRISRLEIPELGDTCMTAVVKGEYGSGPRRVRSRESPITDWRSDGRAGLRGGHYR